MQSKIKYSFLLVALILLSFSCESKQTDKPKPIVSDNKQNRMRIKEYIPKIVNKFPHDADAYTQGLKFYNGYLYESTGQYGKSSLRKVEIKTGKILQSTKLPITQFGEGIAIKDNQIYQLTWENKVVLVYDLTTLKQINQFNFPTEGWGLEYFNNSFVASDGSNFLNYYNPETFSVLNVLMVKNRNQSVYNINEMEIVDNTIYANIYMSESIVMINPQTGILEGIIDISSLRELLTNQDEAEVANGIAYNPESKTFYLTGKYWSHLFEVEFIEK